MCDCVHLFKDLQFEIRGVVLGSGFQSVVPGVAKSASPGCTLETQILGPTLDLLNQKLRGVPGNLLYTNPSIDSDVH